MAVRAPRLDNAVRNSIADGVTYALAAGNDNTNACNSLAGSVGRGASPSAATTSTDARASYSNYGTCLDLFAPGSSITSAWHSSDTATNTISGTSMATPHVAGAPRSTCRATPSAIPAGGARRARQHGDDRRRHQPGHRLSEPAALLAARRRVAAPAPAAPTAHSETYTASLTGHGRRRHPSQRQLLVRHQPGTHYGCLTGPSTADFDLALYRWNGASWTGRRQPGHTVHREHHLQRHRRVLLLAGLLLQRLRQLHAEVQAALTYPDRASRGSRSRAAPDPARLRVVDRPERGVRLQTPSVSPSPSSTSHPRPR